MDEIFKEKGRDEDTSLQPPKALDDLSEEEIYLHAFLLVQGLKEPWLILAHLWDNCPGKETRKGQGGSPFTE